MKKIILFLLCGLFSVALTGCSGAFHGVERLVERRVPWLAGHVVFERIEAPEETFTLSDRDGRLVIGATGANAAAAGVNWYLKYYCHRSMSHMGDNLDSVAELPDVTERVTVSTASTCRYALNYCTFNYTMSFYDWDDWERELDWMALNGVNLMLVANGSEAVWQNTLRRLGYTDDAISGFIAGPAYNAWLLMGNLESWGGPMPQSQIDSRMDLVRKMLARMNELGIEPLMPGFVGLMPSDYGQRSAARVIGQGKWGAFKRPAILDPTDPDFARVAAIFYEETKRLYGDDLRFFSGDPFHEGGITAGVELGDAGRAVQAEMQRHFPGSVWVLQGWQDNPKPGLLEKLDKRYVLVQELFGENTNNWEKRAGYEGTPFIWATVTNFGERPGLNGKLQRFADEVYRARTGPYAACMKGVGVLPEGIDNNPVVYDLILELPWRKSRVAVSEWIDSYVAARYGKLDADVGAAWQLFLETIHSSDVGYQEGPPENILCARPAFSIESVSTWGRLAKKYDKAKFREGVAWFARAKERFAGSGTYRIDLINLLRQVMANDADGVFATVMAAYDAQDMPAFEAASAKFLALHDFENELLAQDPFFRVSTYQRQALDCGATPEEKTNNLRNAMMLVTYWGENDTTQDYLHDYAYKEWAGLMSGYYKERWVLWFDFMRRRLRGEQAAGPDYFAWERAWVETHCIPIADSPSATLDEVIDAMEII